MMQNTKTTLPALETFKKEAIELRKQDKTIKKHTTALNVLAKKYGFKNWATIKEYLATKENTPAEILAFGASPFSEKEFSEYMEKGMALRSKMKSMLEKYGVMLQEFPVPDEVENLIQEVMDFEENNLNHYVNQYLYADIADFTLFMGSFGIATSYALAALELNQRVNDKAGISRAYEVLVHIAIMTNNDEKALEYIQKKIEEGNTNPHDEEEAMFALKASIQKKQGEDKDILYNMDSSTKKPIHFDVLFNKGQEALSRELATRGLMHRMGISRKVAQRYVDHSDSTKKILAAIVDPEKKTIEIQRIGRGYSSFKKIMGRPMAFKRFKLTDFADAFTNDESKEIIYNIESGEIEGINITVSDTGIIDKCPSFTLGGNGNIICHGRAIISGANEEWEDEDIPYALSFFENEIAWV